MVNLFQYKTTTFKLNDNKKNTWRTKKISKMKKNSGFEIGNMTKEQASVLIEIIKKCDLYTFSDDYENLKIVFYKTFEYLLNNDMKDTKAYELNEPSDKIYTSISSMTEQDVVVNSKGEKIDHKKGQFNQVKTLLDATSFGLTHVFFRN